MEGGSEGGMEGRMEDRWREGGMEGQREERGEMEGGTYTSCAQTPLSIEEPSGPVHEILSKEPKIKTVRGKILHLCASQVHCSSKSGWARVNQLLGKSVHDPLAVTVIIVHMLWIGAACETPFRPVVGHIQQYAVAVEELTAAHWSATPFPPLTGLLCPQGNCD